MDEATRYLILLIYFFIGVCTYGHYYKRACNEEKTLKSFRVTTDAWLYIIFYWPIIFASYTVDWFKKWKNDKE